jgi:hypothetical protein
MIDRFNPDVIKAPVIRLAEDEIGIYKDIRSRNRRTEECEEGCNARQIALGHLIH